MAKISHISIIFMYAVAGRESEKLGLGQGYANLGSKGHVD